MFSGGCMQSMDECQCDCHHTGAVHVAACCSPCPYCGVNISMGWLEGHEKEHEENGDTKQEWKDGFPDEWLKCHSFREAVNRTPEDE